jgi:hypothetical protein
VLAESPDVGVPNRTRRGRLVRRILLKATRHHAYYVVEDGVVTVLSVWSTQRGRGPRLP